MPTHPKTNLFSQAEERDRRAMASSPNCVVGHELAVLDYESDSYNPYDTAPQLSDKQIESNFGRRLPLPRK